MALKAPSLILFGYTVDATNAYLDFKAASLGPTLTAILNFGYYSLSGYMTEVARAMSVADPAHIYTVTADRTIAGGLQNRVTIATNGTFLSLLFGTGPHAANNPGVVLGFTSTDKTGFTTYSGTSTTGISILTQFPGYNWVSPNRSHKNFGNVNVSTVGQKESIVYQIQKFFKVEWKYEPETKTENDWQTFFDWAIQQRFFEVTPEYNIPNTFHECTLESTEEDGKGLAFEMKEMLPQFPGLYRTGKLVFRKNLFVSQFLA